MFDLYIYVSKKDVIKTKKLHKRKSVYYNAKQQEQDFWIITNPTLFMEKIF
jgi:hypothetical protein